MKIKFHKTRGFEFLPFIGYYSKANILAIGWLLWYVNISKTR